MSELVIAGNTINPNRTALVPMNSYLSHAIFKHASKNAWTALGKPSTGLVFTMNTDQIHPSMFYYACNRQGYYEIETEHGGATSVYTRDEYLARMESRPLFSIVTRKSKFLFGGFHYPLPLRVFRKLAEEHGRNRDSQRQRMYNWQNRFERQHPHLLKQMSEQQISKMLTKILGDYSIPLDRVFYRDWNDRTKRAVALHYTVPESWLTPGDFMLVVYRFGHTNLGTVLHEIAHSVVKTEYSWRRVEDHGAEYCTILAELFARYADLDIDYIYKSMHASGLRTMSIEDYFDGTTFPKYETLE